MVRYLLVRWVVLSITGVEAKASILVRNLVSHGTLEGAVIDQRHCWQKMVKLGGNKQVVGAKQL